MHEFATLGPLLGHRLDTLLGIEHYPNAIQPIRPEERAVYSAGGRPSSSRFPLPSFIPFPLPQDA